MLAVKNTMASSTNSATSARQEAEEESHGAALENRRFLIIHGVCMSQGGVVADEIMSASLFDLALIWSGFDPAWLPHNFSVFISSHAPRASTPEEAFWWRDLFRVSPNKKACPRTGVRSPWAWLRPTRWPIKWRSSSSIFAAEHCLGWNLGRWIARSWLDRFHDRGSQLDLPDRNTIPHDVAFFQNFRTLMPEVCRERELAIGGGMTALFPAAPTLS